MFTTFFHSSSSQLLITTFVKLFVTTFVQNSCWKLLFKHLFQNISKHLLHTAFAQNSCSKLVLKFCVHHYRLYFFSQLLFSSWLTNFSSQFLFTNLVQNFCSKLLLTSFLLFFAESFSFIKIWMFAKRRRQILKRSLI